jgi:iron transport multicopper oxidase
LKTTIASLTIFSNGQGSTNGAVPASGRIPISTLDECAVNFAVDPSTGVLGPTDYFEPYEYQSLDGGDRDFGSSGGCLLDPTTFSGTGVDRLIVAGGKSGKVYVMNADNLGGFAQGWCLGQPHC